MLSKIEHELIVASGDSVDSNGLLLVLNQYSSTIAGGHTLLVERSGPQFHVSLEQGHLVSHLNVWPT